MLITKETKLGDIVPDNYEIISQHYDKNDSEYQNNNIDSIAIRLRKKEPKDWNFYVDKYLEKFNDNHTDNLINAYIQDDDILVLNRQFKKLDFLNTPIEIKLGFVKYVCDDLNTNYMYCLFGLKTNLISLTMTRIREIFPQVFIDSLYL